MEGCAASEVVAAGATDLLGATESFCLLSGTDAGLSEAMCEFLGVELTLAKGVEVGGKLDADLAALIEAVAERVEAATGL